MSFHSIILQGTNAELSYAILDPSGAFGIVSSTGTIFVKNSLLLDRESVPSFEFQVRAMNNDVNI